MKNTDTPRLIETGETTKPPFSQVVMTLTQEEYVLLKWGANYWKGQFQQVKQKNDDLKQELESAYACTRDLKQRLFGKKLKKALPREIFLEGIIYGYPPGPVVSKKVARDMDGRTALICRSLKKNMILLLKTRSARFVQNPTTFCHKQRIQILWLYVKYSG
ncbi:hypothetical protein [Bathymodiolus japonicus methanotrophic gill symbiont]|uniref:hypothetical protein n=1 Tax=Bathymodiolus japonicus methanotrophic gill symbiont TaxID=113269 RepID=UPI001C8E6465|nr:hypothetical protein [Bathymodiolus japonicus methanotrophic gill symbiont]